jgi:serine/threonine protein kinase
MGTVYEALDMRFDNQVALKETHFTEEALRKQFEREARLLNRLRHPAIARVIDHFTEGEGQYLVMDYIEGEDLWEMQQKRSGAFPIDDVLQWTDQLLDALDYLHSQEPPVIHRDIKPQNLKVTGRNQIILLDFGLAKGFAGQISRVTTSGSIFGYTPNYAPLEQIHGTGTDARSDLYSLAATHYHLLTGKVPPDALSRAMALTSEQSDPLRPANEVNPKVSAEVAEVIQRAMATNPAKRPASAAEMRKALQHAHKPQVPTNKAAQPEDLPSTIILLAPIRAAQEVNERDLPPIIAKTEAARKNQEPSSTVASPTVISSTQATHKSLIESVTDIEKQESISLQPARKSRRTFWLTAGSVVLLSVLVTVLIIAISDKSDAGGGKSSSATINRGKVTSINNNEPAPAPNSNAVEISREPEQYSVAISIANIKKGRITLEVTRNGPDIKIFVFDPKWMFFLRTKGKRYIYSGISEGSAEVTKEPAFFDAPPELTPSRIINQLNSEGGYELLGEERFRGRGAFKYRSLKMVDGQEKESFTYIDKETGLPLQIEKYSGIGNEVLIEFSNIKTEIIPSYIDLDRNSIKLKPEQVRGEIEELQIIIDSIMERGVTP